MSRSPHEQLLFAILRGASDIATAVASVEREVGKIESWPIRDETDAEIWARVDTIVQSVPAPQEPQ